MYRRLKGTLFRGERLTDEIADRIVDLYFRCGGDRRLIGREYDGGPAVTDSDLQLPEIRSRIILAAKEMRRKGVYSREDHVAKLKEIRDAALHDENWKVGLAAEVAVGKAAGLYEKIDPDADDVGGKALPPPENMTTEQIRERIARMQSRALPAPDSEPMRPMGEFREATRNERPF